MTNDPCSSRTKKQGKSETYPGPFPVPLISDGNPGESSGKVWGTHEWKCFSGILNGVNIAIESEEDAEDLVSKGSFGSSRLANGQTCLHLTLEEAFFLSYALGCLLVKNDAEELSILEMWKLFCKLKENFPNSYATYHHFRAKGWVPKDGLKFGTDYVLYKQGPKYYHADYAVKIRTVGQDFKEKSDGTDELTWNGLSGLNRLISSVSKTLLLCNIAMPDSVESPECLKETSISVLAFSRWATPKEQEDERDIDTTF